MSTRFEADYSRSLRSQTVKWPAVPIPSKLVSTVVGEKVDDPCVYFGWQGKKVVYVGKTTCLWERLRKHHVVRKNMFVSWIWFDEKEIHFAELYYIGALRPAKNFKGKFNVPW